MVEAHGVKEEAGLHPLPYAITGSFNSPLFQPFIHAFFRSFFDPLKMGMYACFVKPKVTCLFETCEAC